MALEGQAGMSFAGSFLVSDIGRKDKAMSYKARIPRFATAILLLALTILGCGSNEESGGEGEIAIGLITPLTGSVADLGREMLNCANLGIEHANSAGDISFRLVVRDDRDNSQDASAAAKELMMREGAAAIIGAGLSSLVSVQIEALADSMIPLVTSTATEIDLDPVKRGYFFRVIPPNSAQAQSLAKFARNYISAERIAILFEQENYGVDLKNAFTERFQALGGEILASVPFEPDEANFRAQLNRVLALRPDAIFCPAQHDAAARILVRAREMGIELPILGGETAYTTKLLNAAGDAAQGLYVPGAAIDVENSTPAQQAFFEAYEQRHGQRPGNYGCYTYDAIGVLAAAVRQQLQDPQLSLVDALNDLPSFSGITGEIQFDDAGDVHRDYAIFTYRDGEFVEIWSP